MRLHHSSDAALHPAFPFLRELAETTARLELRHVVRSYAGTEPRPQVDTRPCLRGLLQIETPFIAACRAALSRSEAAGPLLGVG